MSARSQRRHTAAGFRSRLMVAIMVVIAAMTALALYLGQRSVEADVQRDLQAEFQGELGRLLGVIETRRMAISERCMALATSVRIHAALEAEDVENLYVIGGIELRDVVEGKSREGLLRANFFRFIAANGEMLAPRSSASAGDLRGPIELSGGVPSDQQIGFTLNPDGNGRERVQEIVCTPIVGREAGEPIGAVVLGFSPVEFGTRSSRRDLKSGIWLAGRLHAAGLDTPEFNTIISRAIQQPPMADASATLDVGGAPHLLFFKLLNPGSRFEPAYQVCLYPLANSMAWLAWLRWQILGAGALLLLGGWFASRFLAKRFSAPVEQLAEDSAQDRAQREKAEQDYRDIFENAVEGIFVLSPDGRLLSANPALARIFGFESPEQLRGKPAAPRYVEPGQFAELLQRASEQGSVSGFEVEVTRWNGLRIWVSQNMRAVRGPDGALWHFEGTVEDITERKRAGDALIVVNAELEKALGDLKNTQQQIIQQERLRALGQMASGIAHDFNNALVPILGYCELLQLSPATLTDPTKAGQYLEFIHTAAQDASSVVGRLREFYRSKDHRETFAPVGLTKLMEQVITLTRPRWKDQAQAGGVTVEIRTELEPMPAIAGDESALREVFTNLIFNAVDAMPAGGTITIRTQRLGESAVIELSDTGTGMTDEVRRRCLEPFFSTKGERGTGLGLSMVFGIIQRHSGLLDIRSEPGRGTTFVITLPMHHNAFEPGAVKPLTPLQVVPLSVLVVDDEPQVRELLRAALTHDGHEVVLAVHGTDGLKHFLDGEFDLVITDKAMPGMSGDQLAAAIKQIAPKMPIILLTGFGQFLKPEDYPEINVVAAKPISITALRDAISTALKQAA